METSVTLATAATQPLLADEPSPAAAAGNGAPDIKAV